MFYCPKYISCKIFLPIVIIIISFSCPCRPMVFSPSPIFDNFYTHLHSVDSALHCHRIGRKLFGFTNNLFITFIMYCLRCIPLFLYYKTLLSTSWHKDVIKLCLITLTVLFQIKKRTKKLSELFQSYEPYSHQLGKRQSVLVTEIAHDGIHYVGHNKFYEQVLVAMDEDLMGRSFEVEIYETGLSGI